MNVEIVNEYQRWLVNQVDRTSTNPYNEFGKREREAGLTYSKLYEYLWEVEFDPINMKVLDENRWEDGRELRSEFAYQTGKDRYFIYEDIPGPCTMFEFLAALAMRVEFVMQDPDLGDRTYLWFMNSLKSLGLYFSLDWCYDQGYVEYVLDRFMDVKYKSDGRGGVFYIPDTSRDLRDLQIWDQMTHYINWMTFMGEYEGLLRHGTYDDWMNKTARETYGNRRPPDLSEYFNEDFANFS